MVWSLVEELPVTHEWQVSAVPVMGNAILKIEHQWNLAYNYPGSGKALLSNRYDNGSRYGMKILYPTRDSIILSSAIPQHMQDAGFGLRYLAIKRSAYARIMGDANWRIKISEWLG
jgi:hypothetical protein